MVKIVEPSIEIYDIKSLMDIKKHIEKCGRTCYKSEDKITDTSAEKFIEGILKSGHESVIEHANIIFKLTKNDNNIKNITNISSKVMGFHSFIGIEHIYVSANMRTLRDISRLGYNDFDELLERIGLSIFVYDNKHYHCLTGELNFVDVQVLNSEYYNEAVSNKNFDNLNNITVHMVSNLSCYKDITRHRLASFSIESTRFNNYSKGKFGTELTMLKPVNLVYGTPEYNEWLECMNNIESHYMKMCDLGCRADQARLCLPHSVKADIIMTANITEWKHIFGLRCDKAAHPDVRKVMLAALDLFYKSGYTTFEELYNKFLPDIEEFNKK